MKGEDGFTTVYDYLSGLMDYNYCSDSDMSILKMKIWILDGFASSEDGLDNDYNNPQNHYELLSSELYFFDNYIKTKEGTLADGEADFETYKKNKQDFFDELLTQTNPETGEIYKDYEIKYTARPSYISDEQFETLYQKFLTKKSQCPSKVTTAWSLLTSINTTPIDYKISSAEYVYENSPTNDEIAAQNYEAAMQMKEDYDDTYVNTMNSYWYEMWNIIKSLKEDAKEEMVDIDEEPEEDDDGNPIEYSNNTLFVLNVPNIRAIIDVEDPNTFYGMNEDPNYTNCCGYRYAPWNMETNDVDGFMQAKCIDASTKHPDWFQNITKEVMPIAEIVQGMLMESKGSRGEAYNFTAQLDGFCGTFFYICQYYKKVTTINHEATEYQESYQETKEEEIVKQLKCIYDLPEDGEGEDTSATPDALTWNRFVTVNKNWVAVNRIREDIAENIGMRYQIETMFGIQMNFDLKSTLADQLSDAKSLKETYSSYVSENNY